MSLATVVAIALIGAGVGFLGGLFGKGGAAIATPLLALVGIPPIVALASPLPATAIGAYATRWIGGEPLVVATEVILTALGLRFALHPGDPHEVFGPPAGLRTRLALVAAT